MEPLGRRRAGEKIERSGGVVLLAEIGIAGDALGPADGGGDTWR